MLRASILLATLTSAALLTTACSSDAPQATETTTPPPTVSTTAPTAVPTTPSASPSPTAGTPSGATPSAPPTPTSPPKPGSPDTGTFINYENDDEDGIVISTAADTANLKGAPAAFKKFIAAELARTGAGLDKNCPEPPQIYVARLATGGWGAGGYFIPQCGGYAALWAAPKGVWKEAWSGQELVSCKTLTKYSFPAKVSGTSCLEGNKSVTYPRP